MPLARTKRDPAVLALIAVLTVIGLLYLTPLIPQKLLIEFGSFYSEATLVVFALGALAFRAGKSVRLQERRFWFFLALAYAFYLGTYGLYLPEDWEENWTRRVSLAEDTLNILYYAAVYLAFVTPHRGGVFDATQKRYRIELAGAVVLSASLLTYFVLIPSSPEANQQLSQQSGVEAMALYAFLDATIVIGFLILRHRCAGGPWCPVYALLAVSAGIWIVLNMIDMFIYLGRIPYQSGSRLDLLWLLPHATVIVASRLPTGKKADVTPHPKERPGTAPMRSVNINFTVYYLAALPVLHLGFHSAGVLDPVHEPARELCVIGSVVVMSVLALMSHRKLQEEREQFEDRLRRSQKMEAIGRLAEGISHDFNNLLTVVNGYAELLLEKTTDDHPGRDHILRIQDAGRRAAALTGQLRAFKLREVHESVVSDLNALVGHIVDMMNCVFGDEIEIMFEPSPDAWNVRVDRAQIEHVVINLLLNSKDALPGGGRIVLRTSNEPGIDPDRAGQIGHRVALKIEDTGVGIDEAVAERILEPYFTTKAKNGGTGLGLSMARGIAERHGGELSLASRAGSGTVVTIRLPAVAPSVAVPDRVLSEQAPRGRESEVILVVEDDDDVLSVLVETLGEYGYRVTAARGVAEAEEVFARQRDSISLLVTDLFMPDGNGSDLYSRLAAMRPDLKVLFITGYSEPEAISRLGTHRLRPRIQKPFETTELRATVKKLVEPPNRSGADTAQPEPAR